jgi:PPOX class probable F420-dependent enzyme
VSIDDLGKEKYISLATFKRDGTEVATPVWVAKQGNHLYVITEATSGKAKRLRNSSRARIAPCDMRGNVQGPYTDVTAVLLDSAGTESVKKLIDGKYGLMGKVFTVMEAVRRTISRSGESARVGIKISLTDQ